MKDLHLLPKTRDAWSYLYVEHCRIDREDKAIVLQDESGRVPVPCATLSLLLVGPGTTMTHAAVTALADNGCLAMWTGEQGVRFYAQGMGETRSAAGILRQARLWADPRWHLEVVVRMYQIRFSDPLPQGLNLRQIRGREGIRVREAYARASRESGVPWSGRTYRRDSWEKADPINRALSAANSCLYGVCQAAIVAAGYSPALGFIHTGKMLSFVYDIADLYKTEVTFPAAFRETAAGTRNLETRVRHACRDQFHETRLLSRIVPDIQKALTVQGISADGELLDFDADAAAPGGLWSPDGETVAGGVNFGETGDDDDRPGPGTGSDGPAG